MESKIFESQLLQGHRDRVWFVAWSNSGQKLASCSGDKTVRIWAKEASGEKLACTAILEESHTRTVRSCSWSPDDRLLAIASFDATVSIWEVQGAEWTQVATLEGHENEVKGVAWNPSGTLLATCGRDKTVWLWEALPDNEYECLDVKQGHSQDVKAVVWHPKGEVLLSCSYDDTMKLWAESGDDWICAQTLTGHESIVWGAAFDGAGQRMVSCSQDTTLRIWSCQPGPARDEPQWKLLTTISGYHDRPIYSVSWSKSGLIASGCGDNYIRIFGERDGDGGVEVSAGEHVPSFELLARAAPSQPCDINCVTWHPHQEGLLASAHDNGTVGLWHFERGQLS